MTRRALWQTILDDDLATRRAHHAARLAAEHARLAQARRSADDRAIVAAREARVLAGRWHGLRAMVDE